MNHSHLLLAAAVTALMLSGCKPQPTPAVAGASNCMQYAPGMVTLTGVASTRMLSAPGKDSRNALLLTLDTPICIATNAARAAEYPAAEGVDVIELVPQSDHADAYSLAGQRVTVHGGLVPMSGDGVAAPVGLVMRTIKPAQ